LYNVQGHEGKTSKEDSNVVIKHLNISRDVVMVVGGGGDTGVADPSFHYNAGRDPTFHLNTDPDPVLHQSYAICDLRYTDPPGLHFEPLNLLNFYFNVDPDPTC
jgi:hypothetical protein